MLIHGHGMSTRAMPISASGSELVEATIGTRMAAITLDLPSCAFNARAVDFARSLGR